MAHDPRPTAVRAPSYFVRLLLLLLLISLAILVFSFFPNIFSFFHRFYPSSPFSIPPCSCYSLPLFCNPPSCPSLLRFTFTASDESQPRLSRLFSPRSRQPATTPIPIVASPVQSHSRVPHSPRPSLPHSF